MKSPAFQFYPDDFLGSPAVAAMTHAEIGVYMLLLCFDWNGNGLPADERAIARMVKIPPRTFAKMWAVIGGQFVERDGRLYNPRLDKERAKQAEWREKSSVGGKRAAASKAAQASAQVVENQPPKPKGGARVVQPPTQPKGNTPVSSLQSLVTTTATTPAPSAAGDAQPNVFRLAPFLESWREKFGGDPPAARFGKVFKRLVVAKGYGEQEVLRRWLNCLAIKGDFATPEELASKWDRYAVGPVEHEEPLPNAVDGWYGPGMEPATRPDGYRPPMFA